MSRVLVCLSMGLMACSDGDSDKGSSTSSDSGAFNPFGEPIGRVWDYAGITGNRSWLYSRADTRQLIVDDSGGQDIAGDIVNTLTYVVDDAEKQIEYQHTIQWAAGPNIGIEIRGYDGAVYTTPIKLAEATAFVGDTITSVQANADFESTLVGFEPCPNSVSEKWECLYIHVTGGSEEYFVGDWYLANGWGPSIFQPDIEAHDWVLRQTNVIE